MTSVRMASFGSADADLWSSFKARRTARRKEIDHGLWGPDQALESPAASRSRSAHRAPLHSPLVISLMSHFHLTYGISEWTPASPKALKEILDAQTTVNAACTWTHERLSLVAPRAKGRAVLTLPFTRFGLVTTPMTLDPDAFAGGAGASETTFVQGSTRVRDSLWNAHLVAAFLKHVSELHPSLVFDLRDEGGFVVPGAVRIRGGVVEANREFLNRERARVLEVTGDPQAAAPFVWAELQALSGNYFVDTPLSEHGSVPELPDLDARWVELENLSLSDAASLVVDNATKAAALIKA